MRLRNLLFSQGSAPVPSARFQQSYTDSALREIRATDPYLRRLFPHGFGLFCANPLPGEMQQQLHQLFSLACKQSGTEGQVLKILGGRLIQSCFQRHDKLVELSWATRFSTTILPLGKRQEPVPPKLIAAGIPVYAVCRRISFARPAFSQKKQRAIRGKT